MMKSVSKYIASRLGRSIRNFRVVEGDDGMRYMRRAGVTVLLLLVLVLLSACTASEKESESKNENKTSTAAVQKENKLFLERFLSEDHQSVQMENLEWGMKLDNVLETLGLGEGTYSIIRQEENDLNDYTSQIVVNGQIVLGQMSVEAMRYFIFLDDALYLGVYSMTFERVEEMVAVCASLKDQVEQLDLNNRLLRIPLSYDGSLNLLSEDRVRACYEGKDFGELFWVEGVSSRNEFHIAIPEIDDLGSKHTLIIRVESGQIRHIS